MVQEYLNDPYLIEGLKFDMRLYVLVLSCEPMKIFLHKEGLVRFATEQYQKIDLNGDRDSLKNMFIHLTNYALNKDNAAFRQATSVDDNLGHKRSITSLMTTLKEEGKDVDLLMMEIKDVVIKTMLSIQLDLSHNYRACQPSETD